MVPSLLIKNQNYQILCGCLHVYTHTHIYTHMLKEEKNALYLAFRLKRKPGKQANPLLEYLLNGIIGIGILVSPGKKNDCIVN